MAYVITLTNGTTLTTIQDYTVDTTTNLNLIGRGVANYGQYIAEDLVYLLENASNVTPPPAPLKGQLWFNTSTGTLEIYNGETWLDIVTTNSAINQLITITGDATGSGTTTIPLTITPPAGLTGGGTFEKITYNNKGQVTGGVNLNNGDIVTALNGILSLSGTIAATNLNVTLSSGGGVTFSDNTRQTTAAIGRNRAIYTLISGVLKVSVNGAAYTTVGASFFVIPNSGAGRATVIGGGSGSSGCSSSLAAGGCGAGGGWAIYYFSGLTPGGTVPITVGIGGAGSVATVISGAGGSSSFGSYASATGGGSAAGQGGYDGGIGGFGSGGMLVGNGDDGSDGSIALATGVLWPGKSGGSLFGGSRRAGLSGVSGNAGINPGAGASSPYYDNINPAPGAAGAPGMVIVEY